MIFFSVVLIALCFCIVLLNQRVTWLRQEVLERTGAAPPPMPGFTVCKKCKGDGYVGSASGARGPCPKCNPVWAKGSASGART